VFYVIGSGPNGVAAAAAALDEGRPVTMLDVGQTLEPDRLAEVHRLQVLPRSDWPAETLARLQGPSSTANGDLPLKRAYGSTFPYAFEEMARDSQQGTRCLQSFAQGGLSTVWGAAVLPSRERELVNWPSAATDLQASYASVARLMPLAAAVDELRESFPLYGPTLPALRPSRQAALLLEQLRSSKTALGDAGITFGQSRLAVRSVPAAEGSCQYAGLCLTGCPHFAIWSSRDTLRQLHARPGFTYRDGLRVDELDVTKQHGVVIRATSSSGQRLSFDAERVLVACGPLATARLLLHSLRAYGQRRTLAYQPYFLLPMMAARSVRGVENEALHTLAQVFLEIDNPAISPYAVHLQVYTYNPLIGARVERLARLMGPLARPVKRYLNGRLLAVQGYAHSTEAEGITLVAQPNGGDGRPRLELRGLAAAAPVVARTVRLLAEMRRAIGAGPLTTLMEIGLPGDGNHCGGTFPMRDTPGELESDITGQLPRLPGVHVVDSSVLPSLPATTFTYTVMANADRIARTVARSART
jgi:choline dehydrogenase-like flavoprotein